MKTVAYLRPFFEDRILRRGNMDTCFNIINIYEENAKLNIYRAYGRIWTFLYQNDTFIIINNNKVFPVKKGSDDILLHHPLLLKNMSRIYILKIVYSLFCK